MKPHSRANRIAFRRAVAASVVLHAVAAGVFLLLVRSGEERQRALRGIDTRAPDEPQVRMSLIEESAVSVEPPTTAPPPAAVSGSAKPAEEPAPPLPQLPAKPFAPALPRTLPPELLTLIRKPTHSTGAEVEAPVTPGTNNPARSDPNVKPAAGSAGVASATPALHGVLGAGKTVVYLLDCSGSMGAQGKFDAARAALNATLRQQLASVRFQVIVYAGTATPLLAADGNPLAASEANVRAAIEKLAELEPRGRSRHVEAVGAALRFRPDVILVLTDADDLTAAMFKPVLAGRSVPVCVGQVTAGGVQGVRELK